MLRSAHFAALGLLMAGCASAPVAPRPSEKPTSVTIRLEHLPAEQGWQVVYRFSRPVHSARFDRINFGLRQRHWTVLSPAGARLEPADDTDRIVAAEGSALEEVRIRIAPHRTKPEKGYQTFVPYTRGGILAFTGQLDVSPEERSTPDFERRYTLVPLPGERMVVLGRTYDGVTEGLSLGEGTYVFFGYVAPLDSEHLVAVIDPGLPAWLARTMTEMMPRLFAFYAERTRHPLRFKPTVFINYGEEERPKSISTNGGTLEGLVQLEIRLGSAYRAERDPMVLDRFQELLAHEAAHLWNAQMYSHEVPHGDWMHEGGAEAFAFEAQRRLGLISEQVYRDRLTSAASLCALGLEGRPLTESSRDRGYRNYYACGSTLELIAEAAARKSHPDADVFTLWGRLFDAAGKDGHYSDRSFFEALSASGVPAARIEWMRGLIDKPEPHAEERLFEALRQEGVEVERSCEAVPELVTRTVVQRALRHAFRADCGQVKLIPQPDGVTVAAEEGACKVLGAGARIETLGGRSLLKEPFEAYAALAEQCGKSGFVEAGRVGAAEPIRAPCGALVPERVPCLRILKAP